MLISAFTFFCVLNHTLFRSQWLLVALIFIVQMLFYVRLMTLAKEFWFTCKNLGSLGNWMFLNLTMIIVNPSKLSHRCLRHICSAWGYGCANKVWWLCVKVFMRYACSKFAFLDCCYSGTFRPISVIFSLC